MKKSAEPFRKLLEKRKGLVLVVFNLAALLAALYLSELVLFVTDPARKLGPNGMVDGTLYTWGHAVENNRFGFREREFATPKPEGVFRILAMGDSLTWGAGLAVEERYTHQLELRLRQAWPAARFEVLNCGVMGGPTTLERAVLEKLGPVVEPDLIVVGFCLNDPQPRSQFWSVEREAFDRRWGLAVQMTQETLLQIGLKRLGDRFSVAAYRVAEKVGAIPPWYTALDRAYDPDSVEWRDFVAALREIRSMSDAMHAAPPVFAVLNQGLYADRPTDYARPNEQLRLYRKWYAQAEETAKTIGFTTLNVERKIQERLPNAILAVNALDAHPNSALNGLYADKLFEVISRLYQNEQPRRAPR